LNTEIKKLQSGLIKATNVVLNSPIENKGINIALKILGETFSVNKIYICQHFIDEDTSEMYFTFLYEWYSIAYGKDFSSSGLEKISYSRFSLLKFYENLSQGHSLKFNLKKLSKELRSGFLDKRIKSILLVPILIENSYWGFIGLEDFKIDRTWSDEEVEMITKLTKVFAFSLQDENENKSVKKEDRIKSSLIDLDSINSLMDTEKPGFDFFIELLDIYLRDIPSMCTEIDSAVKNNNYNNLKFFAHKLGGSLMHLGVSGALDLCHKLEQAGEEKIIDKKVLNLNEQLHDLVNNILTEIRSLRNKYNRFI